MRRRREVEGYRTREESYGKMRIGRTTITGRKRQRLGVEKGKGLEKA